ETQNSEGTTRMKQCPKRLRCRLGKAQYPCLKVTSSEGQCDLETWELEKFLAQHCYVLVDKCVSCDVWNHRLYYHPPGGELLCNLLHYSSSNHGYRYSTRSILTAPAVELVGE